MKNLEKIKFIITGGTIDSKWVPSKDTVIVKETSGIESYINQFINPDFNISFETVSMKDSREITDDTRARILEVIETSDADKFIITHGTYTMPDTGLYLQKHLKDKAKDSKIVITGSFFPLDGFSPNDASFNLGYAIAAVQNIEKGVYIAMHAQIFKPEDVLKDKEQAHFKRKET